MADKYFITGKTLSEYRKTPDLGQKALEVWSNPITVQSLSLTDKSNIIATLLNRKQWSSYMNLLPYIKLPEIIRAAKILDSCRLKNQLSININKKIVKAADKYINNTKRLTEAIESISTHYQRSIDECKILNQGLTFSLNSTQIKFLKKWVHNISKNDLEFYALTLPTAPWRELANLLHLNPEKDFRCDWFLIYCYNSNWVPPGSILEAAEKINTDFLYYYGRFNFPYSYIRTRKLRLSNLAKATIARKEGLKTTLWYYDELACIEVNSVIKEMLNSEEAIGLSYGALVKTLSTACMDPSLFDTMCDKIENSLRSYKMTLPQPIVVLGDASQSMDVAIRTSGIITSLLTTIAKAELHLFRDIDEKIENPPATVKQAINFGRKMIAERATSPASSFHPYLVTKKIIRTFIIVTDEEENTSWIKLSDRSNWLYKNELTGPGSFAHEYKKYIEQVYPARLVFISFSDPNVDKEMTVALKNVLGKSYGELVEVYKFNPNNPDLTKLDYVLDRLAR